MAKPSAFKRIAKFWSPALGVVAALSMSPASYAEPLDACALTPHVDPGPPGAATFAPQSGTVAGAVGPNSIRLVDGREIRLAGISTPHRFALDPSPDASPTSGLPDNPQSNDDEAAPFDASAETGAIDPIVAARTALNAALAGQTIRFYPVSATADRYGRTRARVVRVLDEAWIDVELLTQGLARAQPQRDDVGCMRVLERFEAVARREKRGLWGLPEFAVLAAGDTTRIRWIGRYVLIEGTVVSFRTVGSRHYLNFGRNFRDDFAVVLVDKSAAEHDATRQGRLGFQSEGFAGPGVVGRRIRARGVLMAGGGGLIFPTVPEDLEWIDDKP